MKHIIINDRTFELHVSRMHNVAPIRGCNESEIYEAYDKPSTEKINKWLEWCKWCRELNESNVTCGIQIESHNVYTFTISGSIVLDGEVFDIFITKKHKRCYQHFAI